MLTWHLMCRTLVSTIDILLLLDSWSMCLLCMFGMLLLINSCYMSLVCRNCMCWQWQKNFLCRIVYNWLNQVNLQMFLLYMFGTRWTTCLD